MNKPLPRYAQHATIPPMRTLLAIAVVFVLAGCAGEAAPLPDIDATVEARLGLAKASLVAPTAGRYSQHATIPP